MKLVIAEQIHSARVLKVSEPSHRLKKCDGLVTDTVDLSLVAYGADCALLAFWDGNKVGVCHAGWRGLVSGVIQNTMAFFENTTLECFIGPFLHQFEIKKDECYDILGRKFGDRYFIENDQSIFFDFKKAVIDTVGSIPFRIDDRSTGDHSNLASWRRDRNKGDGTQNRIVVARRSDGSIFNRVYEPSERIVQ